MAFDVRSTIVFTLAAITSMAGAPAALAQDDAKTSTPGAEQPSTPPAAAEPSATPTAPQSIDITLARAIDYLRAQQDPASGGWSVNPQGPNFPAITGLVIIAMSDQARAQGKNPADDPAIAKGVAFILSNVRPDGGIYDTILPSYNTAICIEALVKVGTPAATAPVKAAQEFLKSLQWGEGAVARENLDESAQQVDRSHPFYGGWGYGRHGRPDLSNTAWALEGLRNSGVPESDPAFQRALVFLQRVQMDARFNEAPYAAGSTQGGFIYATSENKDTVGSGQSHAGTIEETLSDGTKASRLRSYGSMTYSGFKSLIYAGLQKDDPRVQAALDWLRRNYTLTENPGVGTDGMYYYYVVLARALRAYGAPTLDLIAPDGGATRQVDWRQDLAARFAALQSDDGSFKVVDDRWMEDNPVLITAYGVVALTSARQ